MPPASPRRIGPGSRGLGKGKSVAGQFGKGFKPRRRKITKDSLYGISKGDIRRLARRGGVKRLSASVYDEIRASMRTYLDKILGDCCAYLEHAGRKTVTVTDVVFALKRIGRPIYGFDDAPRRR